MATRKLYRSNYGEIFGVCKGFAQWRDLPVGGVRLVVILIAVFTAVFPCLIAYVILGIFMPANPDERPSKADENGDGNNYRRGSGSRSGHFYSDYESSRKSADYAGPDEYEDVSDSAGSDDSDEALRKRYEELKKKVEKMEESVLDKENDWDQRFKNEEK
jgi:phage shock protein C